MKYELYVDDNYYYDEDDRYKEGEYETIAAAIDAAKTIVDGFLKAALKKWPGATAEELYGEYKRSGEDPWIHPNHSDYNSWEYAKQRCVEICGNTRPLTIEDPLFVVATSLGNQNIS